MWPQGEFGMIWWDCERKRISFYPDGLMKAKPFLTLTVMRTPHPHHQKILFHLQNASRISPLLPTSTAATLFPTPGILHLGPHASPRASMLLPLLPSTHSEHSSWDNVSQIM